MGAQSRAAARMHTLAMPKSVLCIELGPQWPLAHYELAYLIKKYCRSMWYHFAMRCLWATNKPRPVQRGTRTGLGRPVGYA